MTDRTKERKGTGLLALATGTFGLGLFIASRQNRKDRLSTFLWVY